MDHIQYIKYNEDTRKKLKLEIANLNRVLDTFNTSIIQHSKKNIITRFRRKRNKAQEEENMKTLLKPILNKGKDKGVFRMMDELKQRRLMTRGRHLNRPSQRRYNEETSAQMERERSSQRGQSIPRTTFTFEEKKLQVEEYKQAANEKARGIPYDKSEFKNFRALLEDKNETEFWFRRLELTPEDQVKLKFSRENFYYESKPPPPGSTGEETPERSLDIAEVSLPSSKDETREEPPSRGSTRNPTPRSIRPPIMPPLPPNSRYTKEVVVPNTKKNETLLPIKPGRLNRGLVQSPSEAVPPVKRVTPIIATRAPKRSVSLSLPQGTSIPRLGESIPWLSTFSQRGRSVARGNVTKNPITGLNESAAAEADLAAEAEAEVATEAELAAAAEAASEITPARITLAARKNSQGNTRKIPKKPLPRGTSLNRRYKGPNVTL